MYLYLTSKGFCEVTCATSWHIATCKRAANAATAAYSRKSKFQRKNYDSSTNAQQENSFLLTRSYLLCVEGEMVSKKSRAETCIAEYIIYNITWHINYRISTSKYMYLYTYNIYIYMFIYLHICFNVYIYADIELLTYMCFVKIQFYGRLTWQINASVGNEKTLGSLQLF